MLTSRAFGGLAKLLEALRAHDARVVEALSEPQARSHTRGVQTRSGEGNDEAGESPDADKQGRLSVPARELLKFSTPRDPASLAALINLRVLNPEHAHWRRGIAAATPYHRHHGDLRVPFTHRVPASGDQVEGEAWPASLAAFPLGQWAADALVWSHCDVAWEEGLAAARGWAKEHGHPLAPADATYKGYRVGLFLKNARAAARRAAADEQWRAEGLPVPSATGALFQERREQLDAIDPAWCPTWPVGWQRCFHLVRRHLDAGDTLPAESGAVVHQGEDLGRWARAQQLGFDELTGAQQWMLERILGIQPAGEEEKPKPRRSQADKWALNLTAARQY